jgi:hypothetical protein
MLDWLDAHGRNTGFGATTNCKSIKPYRHWQLYSRGHGGSIRQEILKRMQRETLPNPPQI